MSRKRRRGPPKKIGRPRKEGTTITTVRVKNEAFDRYCQLSNRSGEDIRTLMRWVLEMYAPPIWPHRI